MSGPLLRHVKDSGWQGPGQRLVRHFCYDIVTQKSRRCQLELQESRSARKSGDFCHATGSKRRVRLEAGLGPVFISTCFSHANTSLLCRPTGVQDK